jgi:hypothetical protein
MATYKAELDTKGTQNLAYPFSLRSLPAGTGGRRMGLASR